MTEQELVEDIGNHIFNNYRETIYNSRKLAQEIHKIYQQAGYVQLDDDQSLPSACTYRERTRLEACIQTQDDMLKAGFRKVK